MRMNKVNQGILVSIDMLFDTRLACLAKMNVDYPSLVLEKGWKKREGDLYEEWIPNFDKNQFNNFYYYRGRDGDVLKNSLVTNYLARLIGDMRVLEGGSKNHPLVGEVFLEIDIWPYEFNGDEERELIDILSGYLGNGIRVGVVRMGPKRLTPKVLRTRWASFATYNFDEWFSLHHEALLETPIPSVVCVTPRLLKEKPTEKPETDPTLEITGALVEFLGLEWITPYEVSIAI